MNFAEFSSSTQMQIILFFISAIAAYIHTWTALNLIQTLYDEEVQMRKKIIYITIVSVVFYVGGIYGVFAFRGFEDLGALRGTLLKIPNPLAMLLNYFIISKYWNFASQRLIPILRQVYTYSLFTRILGVIISYIFPKRYDSYNYFEDGVETIIFIALCLLIYFAGRDIIGKHRFIINMNNSLPVNNRTMLIASFTYATFMYILSVYLQLSTNNSILVLLIILVMLIMFLVVDVMLTYYLSLKNDLDNKNSYIGSLVQTVDHYTNLRNEFGNILANFDSRLENGDWDQISAYHESLMGKTTLTTHSHNISRRMEQNPVLVSLLLKKLDYASQFDVHVNIPVLCPLDHFYIDTLDLSRMLSNLLNNAIEAAAESKLKKISFSITQKNALSKLIVITNTTKGTVDIDGITQNGATTKKNHQGVGLTQVKNIIRKHANCTLNFSYCDYEFSVYIEIRNIEGN